MMIEFEDRTQDGRQALLVYLNEHPAPPARHYGRPASRKARRVSLKTSSNGGRLTIWPARRADQSALKRASFLKIDSCNPRVGLFRNVSFWQMAGSRGARSRPPRVVKYQRW